MRMLDQVKILEIRRGYTTQNFQGRVHTPNKRCLVVLLTLRYKSLTKLLGEWMYIGHTYSSMPLLISNISLYTKSFRKYLFFFKSLACNLDYLSDAKGMMDWQRSQQKRARDDEWRLTSITRERLSMINLVILSERSDQGFRFPATRSFSLSSRYFLNLD